MDFKFEITPYQAPVKLTKKITLSIPTQAEFDAATTACCGPHPYKYHDVIVKVWRNDKTIAATQAGVLPVTAVYSIGDTYKIAEIGPSICTQLSNKLKKFGYSVSLSNGNEITIEAGEDEYFNVTGEDVAGNSVVITVTPLTYSIGGGKLTRQQEIWDAAHDGFNIKFEKSLMGFNTTWKDDWRSACDGAYDTLVIETKTEYQYELLTNDNKGLWKKQFIVAPQGSAVLTTIVGLLNSIGSGAKHLSDPADIL